MFYQKKGRAKYISHLDINRLMQRVLKRAGLPVWYTEGFNPHIYLTFALPLSLGYESDFETMDFRLTEEMNLQQVQQILNQNMPEGILVTRVAEPVLNRYCIGRVYCRSKSRKLFRRKIIQSVRIFL